MFNPFKNLPASQELHTSPAVRRYEGNPILTAKDVPYPADQVFTAVTGYLYTMTGTVITVGVIGIVLSLCLFLFSGILRRND